METAKRLVMTGIGPTPEGVRVELASDIDRYFSALEPAEVGGVIQLLMAALSAHHGMYAMGVSGFRLPIGPAAGRPPPLVVDGANDQVIVLNLTWEQVADLAALARGMLMAATDPAPEA